MKTAISRTANSVHHLLSASMVLVCALLVGSATTAAVLAQESLHSARAAAASDLTPARAGASEAAYLLGPEDVVEVFVWKEEGLSTTATVRPDGRITLPLAGELMAAKRTAQQLQEEIATRLAHYIDLPVVTVIVKEINSPLFSVLGEVRRPGRYRLAQRTSVLDAVALGGGFTEYADRGRVTVLRPSERGVERIPINLKKLLRRGGETFYLQPRDTVHVE